MMDTEPMAVPVAVIDALNSLLEAEQGSIFRYLEESSPYLSRAAAGVRGPLHERVEANHRHCGELYRLIEELGGTPRPRPLRPQEQYLAYLSLKFLLPKLVDEQALTVRRNENALQAIGHQVPKPVTELLQRHLSDQQAALEVLKKASADVLAEK